MSAHESGQHGSSPGSSRAGRALFDGHFIGRRVIVTGASQGIGAGIATAFARSGADVILSDRDDAVVDTANALAEQGLHASAVLADVTDEAQVDALMAAADERLGGLDVLVNNAGIITISNLEELSLADFERVLAVNTTGVFLCCRAATPLLKRSGGSILNAASGQARRGMIYTPHYAASKHGVIGITQSLATELAADNIRVNAYCPGIVETPMWEYNDREWGSRLGDYEPGELIKEWIDGIPLRRAATNDDVANLLLFLASDAATYITGQAINIDGGMFMN